jgi:hypothetical protein
MARVDNFSLTRWRELNAVEALRALADYVKEDPTFKPRNRNGTTRWHVSVAGCEFELLCSDTNFFDARARRGGGGAVDLAMHLFELDFKSAIKLLRERGL